MLLMLHIGHDYCLPSAWLDLVLSWHIHCSLLFISRPRASKLLFLATISCWGTMCLQTWSSRCCQRRDCTFCLHCCTWNHGTCSPALFSIRYSSPRSFALFRSMLSVIRKGLIGLWG